jgi:hypothetical protein
VKAKTPKGKEYTTVSTIMYEDKAPLHEDQDLAKTWMEDELTWLDVYSKKPVEYLEAIARGETPKWDSEKGGYIYDSETTGTESFGGSKPNDIPQDPQSNDEPDEDLPF